MIVFGCHVCRTSLSAEDAQTGQLVRCPTCLGVLRVPAQAAGTGSAAYGAAPVVSAPPAQAPPPSVSASMSKPAAMVGAPVGAGSVALSASSPAASALRGFAPSRTPGKRYGFNCAYCSSRLEANESMAAQEGQCPTCGNNITIPILDRYGRLIDPKTRQIIKQDPHPVHAYAAAGDRAPAILREPDGAQFIQCPRCRGRSPITANNCKSCGMPFTMEGTTIEASGASNGFCVASLVLGIIGLPTACALIPPVLAIIFGVVGLNQLSRSGTEGGGKGMAIAGIILGAIGCFIAAMFLAKM